MPSNTPPEHMYAGSGGESLRTRTPFLRTSMRSRSIPQRESFQEYVDRCRNGMGLQF